MKINLSTIGLLFVLSLHAHAQTRSDSFTGAKATVVEIVLNPLPDGGCAARWHATLTSDDGGTTLEAVTPQVHFQAVVQQNRCAGLVSAGANRVLKAFRLPDDGGTP